MGKDFKGKIDFDKDITTYSNNVVLNEEQVKALSSNPVTKIGVEWDKDYQEYQLEKPHAFVRQMTCIEKKLY